MRTLRFRLLASYLVLMLVTLGVIAIAVLFTTSAQVAPSQPSFQRLTALARGLNMRNLVDQFTGDFEPVLGFRRVSVDDLLADFADRSGVRVLRLSYRLRDEEPVVTFDSANELTLNALFPGELNVRRGAPDNLSRLDLAAPSEQIYGEFRLNGQEWLFSGVAALPRPLQDEDGGAVLVAIPRPTQSLQQLLAEFGTDLFLPLIQAGLAGLVVAVGLAFFISRTIARPLQAVSRAATAVARGDLDQQVPVSGPTEVRAVAEAFNYMSAEVRATQQAQRDFMANVSHDLKTPLTSIQGYSQAIMDGAIRQPEQAAAIIHDEAGRLTRMVNELTDLARMQAGQFSLHVTTLDISTILSTVTEKLQVMARQKGIRLEVKVPILPEVAGDGDRLVQVFNNLIGNAIKYTPEQGRVWVIARPQDQGVEVLIRDNGIGIPKKDLPRIFERFYQVDKARGPKRGTGLGLAITYEIIQAHGGSIDVASIEGHGTQFSVHLPYAHKAQTIIRQAVRES
ncbi:MAG: sensor histidine kinase [Chloroflexota bacterium]